MRVVILNADDLGYDPAVSRGVELALRQGVVSSTTLMVNGPHAQDGAARAGGLKVGLHLNLARWAPLSSVPAALLGPDGAFDEAKAALLPPDVVEHEALAQLDRLHALLGRAATHLDVHKHLHRHPNVLQGVAAAAARRDVPVRSMDEGTRKALRKAKVPTNDVFVGDAGAEPYWTPARFAEALRALPATGVVELMCHPGYAPSQVQSGYASQREVELATFLAPEARAALAQADVRLWGWDQVPR